MRVKKKRKIGGSFYLTIEKKERFHSLCSMKELDHSNMIEELIDKELKKNKL